MSASPKVQLLSMVRLQAMWDIRIRLSLPQDDASTITAFKELLVHVYESVTDF